MARWPLFLFDYGRGGVVPTGRVTRQFGVDLEAICESVQALRRTKVPVKSRTKGKCFLMRNFLLPPMVFATTRINTLVATKGFLGYRKSRSFVGSFSSTVCGVGSVLGRNRGGCTRRLRGDVGICDASKRGGALTSGIVTTVRATVYGGEMVSVRCPTSKKRRPRDEVVRPVSLKFCRRG